MQIELSEFLYFSLFETFYALYFVSACIKAAGVWSLVQTITSKKTCAGISIGSQRLILIASLGRFVSLFYFEHGLYQLVEAIGIAGVVVTNYLIHTKYHVTYEKVYDTFRIEFLLVPAVLLSLVLHVDSSGPAVVDILWTFSVYLESVALFPQIFLISRTNNIENLTKHYIGALGVSRILEMVFWLYISFKTMHVMTWIPTYMAAASLVVGLSNLVHTVLLSDFLWKYLKSVKLSVKGILPTSMV
uniref:ER lumen protein-retaining receptor n=1 Tax=Palpitomonas bilix TaxID=652834 RepID=A0A7S3D6Y3_9EUKA|mmetsp:Transcript_24310/g.61342  ORF Transcript_24310/g.61342 Transcript_24310/m.61342 type:complete len:245 (+) Transcript_24310:40-774(+)